MERDQNELNSTSYKGSRKARFLKRTWITFFILVVVLAAVGLAPKSVSETTGYIFSMFINDNAKKEAEISTPIKENAYAEPVRIVIPKIGTDIKVVNPVSSENKILDGALLLGAVRYPSSGDLESKRTMFLFGHSSYLPVVHNQAYKAFNEIQKLNEGDEITLYSSDRVYRYKVEKVEKVLADDSFVNLSEENHKLILSTCDVFGSKQERFVVTAGFVGSFSVAS